MIHFIQLFSFLSQDLWYTSTDANVTHWRITMAAKDTKVFWTKAEADTVALKAGQLVQSGEEKHLGPALIRAQRLMLPSNRLRTETSLKSVVTQFKLTVDRVMREEYLRQTNAVSVAAQVEAAAKEKEAADAAQLLAEEAEEKAAEERATTRAAAEASNVSLEHKIQVDVADPTRTIQPDFIQSICRNIAGQFENNLVAELTAAVERAHLRVASLVNCQIKSFEELPKVKPNRPKVVIAGFKSHLNHELYAEFNEHLDMRFFDADVQPRQLAAAASTADHVLLIKKFVGHNLREVIDRHPGFFLVQGSITAAKEKLLEIATR